MPSMWPRQSKQRVRGVSALARCAWAVVVAGWAGVGACDRPGSGETERPLAAVAMLGGPGISPGLFDTPRAIDTDGSSLWVVDKGTARVQRLEARTGRCVQWWSMPEFAKGKPCGLVIGPRPGDADGSRRALWVVDTHYQRVMVYALPAMPEPPAASDEPAPVFAPGLPPIEPELLTQFGGYGTGPGEFIYPTGIAILTNAAGGVQRVYISEYGGNDRVSVFDDSLKYVRSFGRAGSGATGDDVQFDRPQSLAIDARRGELIVTDARNHRVGRFTLEGALLAWYGGPDEVSRAPGRFNYPWGVLAPGDGTALITEFGNGRVQRIDLATGRSLWMSGRPGRGAGQLAGPWATAVLGERAYTLDTFNHRIVVWNWPG